MGPALRQKITLIKVVRGSKGYKKAVCPGPKRKIVLIISIERCSAGH